MTLDEVLEEVEVAKRKAHGAALRISAGYKTSEIVDVARMRVLETMVAALMCERSQYQGTTAMKTALELRDYWEMIAEEIAK
jgi:hypothetical protein